MARNFLVGLINGQINGNTVCFYYQNADDKASDSGNSSGSGSSDSGSSSGSDSSSDSEGEDSDTPSQAEAKEKKVSVYDYFVGLDGVLTVATTCQIWRSK